MTLRVLSREGRDDYLWEIGSGANWVGYHVAALLALHEVFLENSYSPVPQFLILDQPSQVYFPESWPGDPNSKSSTTPDDPKLSDDIRGVHRIFSALAEGLTRMKDRVQLIVIDHADEITWSGIKNIHVVERWRDGNALIPSDW